MVVHEDDGRIVELQRVLDHLAWIDRFLADRAPEHLHMLDDPMLRIQMQDCEDLVLHPCQLEFEKVLDHLRRRQRIGATHPACQQALSGLQDFIVAYGR